MTAASTLSCGRHSNSPELLYEHANQTFLAGDLKQSQDEAERGYRQFRDSDPEWSWKFRNLQAKSALWRGLYENVLQLLDPASAPLDQPNVAIPRLALVAVAEIYLHDFSRAEAALNDADKLCSIRTSDDCGDVLQARGFLASEQKQPESAKKYYERSLSFATSHHDPFLESTSFLNLGSELLSQGRFDEAIDQSQAAHNIAEAINARAVDLVVKGNLGWAYYQLGDLENAFTLSAGAEALAKRLNDVSNEENQLTNLGYIYMDQRKFDLAAQSFRQAFGLAKSIEAKEQIYNALRVLARLAVQTGDLDKASDYAEQALTIARESHNHVDELYPTLVQGQIAARRGDAPKARRLLEAVERDPLSPVFLKWEAQRSLARLYEDEKQSPAADREYRAALATFESARASVQREDFQLSFLTNAVRIYDDYVHFLVAQEKIDEALRWADYSRARTLAEGLGLLSKSSRADIHAAPSALNPREISRKAKSTLLFYWLGEKQSYMWTITAQKTSLFPLPPGPEIDALVERYRKALGGPQDVLESQNEDGRALYRTLIAPAKELLASESRVIIIPDGSLNNLNFETLVVPEPKPHFWIEDTDVTNASSLRVLAASLSRNPHKNNRRLLLIGDTVAPSKEYPELPRAAQQMANVAKHFPATQEQVYQRGRANPAAYADSDPGNFSHIHFVAHGTASRLSPLDSAIVLSKDAAGDDSFKLYARDIIRHPLHADLVTISACYGAGERAYSGEGLVGLAWAFLRAGAHNVIAGLWEVTDASTEQLMDHFYDELDKGAAPDAALRAAKLSLLHGRQFRNPFYWAPFQFYTGS